MKKAFTAIAIVVYLAFLSTGCRSGTSSLDAGSFKPDTAGYFSLEGYFRSQIEYVDLRNFDIWLFTTADNHTDSMRIDKDGFKQWAQVFLDRSFTPEQKPRYRETVFQDLSTDSYILNYTPVEKGEFPVNNVDVLLNRETSQPKRIFIKSIYSKGDTLVEEQCNWKADRSFQVNRVKTAGDKSITELHTVSWNGQR